MLTWTGSQGTQQYPCTVAASIRLTVRNERGTKMGELVCTGALLTCTFGAMPASFTASGMIVTAGTPVRTVADFAPMANIESFGMCMSPANPQVAAATSAALGVLTPQPCIPAIVAPWAPGSLKVQIGGVPALDSSSTCNCMWAGMITVSSPGQMSVTD